MLKSLLINLRYWSIPMLALFTWLGWVIGWDGNPEAGMHPVLLASVVMLCLGVLMLVVLVLVIFFAPDISDIE